MHEKEMPASQSLPFLLHVSLYHEFATQESLLSCAEIMNDKIFKHEVRQAFYAWILELLYHEFATQESLTSKTLFSNRKVRSIINTNKTRTDEREKQ